MVFLLFVSGYMLILRRVHFTLTRGHVRLATSFMRHSLLSSHHHCLLFNTVLSAQRSRLPIFKHREEILYLLENFQTVIIVGETG